MNTDAVSPAELRKAFSEALPPHEQTGGTPREPRFTYVPQSHARALDPDKTLVEGMRGAGKSHWWAALNSQPHREYLETLFPEAKITGNLKISQGFGVGLSSLVAPKKDTLAQLVVSHDARHIWQTVIAVSAGFPHPFPLQPGEWNAMVPWVEQHPEQYDLLLEELDQNLGKQKTVHLVLFDALDRLADDWPAIRPLARSLLQLALDMRANKAIKLKLFVRPDMLQDREILAFPDSSKLLAQKVALTWRSVDLYALLFQCLANAENHDNPFRMLCERQFGLNWRKDEILKLWPVPNECRADKELQSKIFHALTGPWMGSGAKRGAPYTWLVNHLTDTLNQVSPRSFSSALRHAVDEEPKKDWPYALDYHAIQHGVREASHIRVQEMTFEDYPWVNTFMQPLRNRITVPCEAADIIHLWRQDSTLSKLQQLWANTETEVRLPPQHLNAGEQGVLADLEALGVIQTLTDGRIQMPDIYRLAFGLGRKGGVKPLR